ncbi:MAG: hypothetical protein IH617_17905 [Hydrogenophaga sp.]|nr:hypothetical protein [Hydrogenophaga sp.]
MDPTFSDGRSSAGHQGRIPAQDGSGFRRHDRVLVDAPVTEHPSSKWSFGSLFRFLLLHALILMLVNLGIGWVWFQAYRQNEFSGLALVTALYASPVLVLLAVPFHAWIHRQATHDRKHRMALAVSMVCVGLFNLVYFV